MNILKNNKGLSLYEMVISSTIITIFFLVLTTVYVNLNASTATSFEKNYALSDAQHTINYFQNIEHELVLDGDYTLITNNSASRTCSRYSNTNDVINCQKAFFIYKDSSYDISSNFERDIYIYPYNSISSIDSIKQNAPYSLTSYLDSLNLQDINDSEYNNFIRISVVVWYGNDLSKSLSTHGLFEVTP